MYQLNAFHSRFLIRICNIYWSNKISNDELYAKTECYSMATEVKHRRLRWLGHVLRMEMKRIPKKDIRWNPKGKRKQGRPKMTLCKTFEGDFKKMELTWGTAERVAKERISWRKRSVRIILNGLSQRKKKNHVKQVVRFSSLNRKALMIIFV